VALRGEMCAPGIFGVTECRDGVLLGRSELHCKVTAGVFKEQRFVPL
jgi:hypothetical protein